MFVVVYNIVKRQYAVFEYRREWIQRSSWYYAKENAEGTAKCYAKMITEL